MFRSMTTGALTKMPPQTSRSNRHFGTVAMRSPFTMPARAGISTPWQTLIIGLPCSQNQRVTASRASSSRMYSGARPPLKKMPAYCSGLMSLKAMSELMV